MPNQKPARRNHICPVCSVSFSKKEHLARHTRSHTLEKPFRCNTCGKVFGRNDTLLRHARGHHAAARNAARHEHRHITKDTGPPPPPALSSTSEAIASLFPPDHHGTNNVTGDSLFSANFTLNRFPPQGIHQLLPSNSTISPEDGFTQEVSPPPGSGQNLAGDNSGLGSNNSSNLNETVFNHIHGDEDIWRTGLDSQISALLTNANLDLSTLELSMMLPPDGVSSENYNQLDVERMNSNYDLVDPTPSHKEDSIRKLWFTFVGLDETGMSTPDNDAEQTHVDEIYRQNLSQQLQPRVPSHPLPSTEFMNLCIRMYFTRFNPMFPIIHVPTFRLSKKSSLLLLSICCLGSLLLGSTHAATHGQNIFDRLSKAALISWNKYISRGRSEALSIIQSALIGHTFALLSGRPTDLLTVQSFHGTIISWARRYGIFRHQQGAESNVCGIPGVDLETAWKTWAQVEERKRLAVGLCIHDSEYSALLRTAPLMAHTTSKVPFICAKSLWDAPTAEEWRRALETSSQNVHGTQNLSVGELFSLSTHVPRSPEGEGPEQDPFSVYCKLEGIATSVFAAKELVTWSNIPPSLEEPLLQFYDDHLSSKRYGVKDPLCLEILWHYVCMSLYTDLDQLEICAGRDGYEEAQQYLTDVRDWAKSPTARRCALHGALILQKSVNLPVGGTPAIHLPRVLYCAAMVWYCYTEFGRDEPSEASSFSVPEHQLIGECAELKKLGIDSLRLLFEAHGFKVARPTKLESSTLYELVDLLRRQGHWGISRRLASLMSVLIHGDMEVEVDGMNA